MLEYSARPTGCPGAWRSTALILRTFWMGGKSLHMMNSKITDVLLNLDFGMSSIGWDSFATIDTGNGWSQSSAWKTDVAVLSLVKIKDIESLSWNAIFIFVESCSYWFLCWNHRGITQSKQESVRNLVAAPMTYISEKEISYNFNLNWRLCCLHPIHRSTLLRLSCTHQI